MEKENLKVLLINSSDSKGGAARATYRLYRGLKERNINSKLLVQSKRLDEEDIVSVSKLSISHLVRSLLDRFLFYLYLKRKKSFFSTALVPDTLPKYVKQINPDIIHLNWINDGFIKIESLNKFNKPIVWTLHDSWPFTGGCHLPGDCKRFTYMCGECPVLNSKKSYDLSWWIWKRKKNSWGNINLTIVTPSVWLATCAKKSSLFKELHVEIIPNGIDTSLFKPRFKTNARIELGLPLDKKLILFGSMNLKDKNKGYEYFISTLKILERSEKQEKIEIIIFGASNFEQTDEIKLKVNSFGKINDDYILSLLYSSADVYVMPSEQENLPCTIMESLSCGTPVVAFKIGGISDLIDHKINGYLAVPFSIEDLSDGILWLLDNKKYGEISKKAREKVLENFEISNVVKKYLMLYRKIRS